CGVLRGGGGARWCGPSGRGPSGGGPSRTITGRASRAGSRERAVIRRRRVRQVVSERLSGAEREVRVPQGLTPEEDDVGLPGREDLLSLERFGDQPDRRCRNAGLLPYSGGERAQVARTTRDRGGPISIR